MRLTADCPLLESSIIDQVISMVYFEGADYASNTLAHTWPDGLDCEVALTLWKRLILTPQALLTENMLRPISPAIAISFVA